MARRFQFASLVEESEIAFVEAAAAAGRVRLIDGTEEIAEGVTAIAVGGHSPGQLITVVEKRATETSCSRPTRCTSTRSSSSTGPSPW